MFVRESGVRQVPIPLSRTEIVGVADLLAQCFENRPVARRAVGAKRIFELGAQVKNRAIVVEQRVVDVYQEDGVGVHRGGAMY